MEIEQILFEYDCEPVSHTCVDSVGNKYYCHAIDYNHYAMVIVSNDDINNLINCDIDVLSLFLNKQVYLTDVDHKDFTKVDFDGVKSGLPKKGVTLYPKRT